MKISTVFCIVFMVVAISSCNKMDVKPKQSLVVPTTLRDFQGLLDNTDKFNTVFPVLGEIGAGDYSVTDASYNSLSPRLKGAYLWSKQMYGGLTADTDWDNSYQRIFYCNVIFDGLKFQESQGQQNELYSNVMGQALFHRSLSFFNLMQQFAPPYTAKTKGENGIPLRLTSNLNTVTKRNTVEENYNQIIRDLSTAKNLLPINSIFKTRPSKSAVYGLLSRIYLSKGDFPNALVNADSCLLYYNKLIDYNSLSSSATFPLLRLNDEVIFHANFASVLSQSMVLVSNDLFNLYDTTDLRQSLYFRSNGLGNYLFKGSYYGSSIWFCGIATDEIFLIRAECYARLGKAAESMADLNTLLSKRYKNGFFNILTSLTADQVLTRVIVERRKELLFRGIRWGDLRRLNLELRFASTLSRTVGGNLFTLPQNDSRYTLPIPDYIIAATGIQQNP